MHGRDASKEVRKTDNLYTFVVRNHGAVVQSRRGKRVQNRAAHSSIAGWDSEEAIERKNLFCGFIGIIEGSKRIIESEVMLKEIGEG